MSHRIVILIVINHENLITITLTLIPPSPLLSSKLCLLNVRSLSNISFICQDLILILFVCQRVMAYSRWACPSHGSHSLRSLSGGAGVIVIRKSALKCSTVSIGPYSSFIHLSVKFLIFFLTLPQNMTIFSFVLQPSVNSPTHIKDQSLD